MIRRPGGASYTRANGGPVAPHSLADRDGVTRLGLFPSHSAVVIVIVVVVAGRG
jgi:hypothetical protein